MQDDWLHADLHPGNIIVRTHEGPPLPMWLEQAGDALLQPTLGIQVRDCLRSITLSILDAGMVTSMGPGHFAALVDVYSGLAHLDGAVVGEAMTRLRHMESSASFNCKAFQDDVDTIFRDVDRQIMRDRTHEVVGEVLESMRRHRMTLDGAAAATMLTVLTLEGWATKLDPDIRILDTIGDLLPRPRGERLQTVADLLLSADVLDA